MSCRERYFALLLGNSPTDSHEGQQCGHQIAHRLHWKYIQESPEGHGEMRKYTCRKNLIKCVVFC